MFPRFPCRSSGLSSHAWVHFFSAMAGQRCGQVYFLLDSYSSPCRCQTLCLRDLFTGCSKEAATLRLCFMRAFGVPFFRDGLVFQLPGFTIEVAPECSGIRSSIGLLISTVLLSQFLLRSNWRKLALCMLVLPLAMFKNGLRIATLSILSVYVSRDFLYGWLHHSGGVVFFLIGIAFIYLALRVLQFNEQPFAPSAGKTAFVSQSVRKAEI